mmetsp:Transcript_22624/g.49657  ORF Transcript_22624/g.49657 Transcript_22624/m.49657 type:complete len:568 (-) Transcript_22624:390-2093(-)|eukprot:CAMPEP_0206454896 /NCGR_PEP_ID=MMETSP0324_2-20121206/21419_1 /ASSEMBLY_ACC=CAM_ASM_000836 /TAXON_ID=2866 /ORGANISM="Crypthecodinium cohnii, Strain Seligo" /LENGTH=567 /DNA_ID=CAMNT_0053925475 /DNA_START=218 /DNA_END=1921 /DNA_ORIENTATION=-
MAARKRNATKWHRCLAAIVLVAVFATYEVWFVPIPVGNAVSQEDESSEAISQQQQKTRSAKVPEKKSNKKEPADEKPKPKKEDAKGNKKEKEKESKKESKKENEKKAKAPALSAPNSKEGATKNKGKTGCEPPRPFTSLLDVVPNPAFEKVKDLQSFVSDKTFAWCDNGSSKNGEFKLNKDGSTGGDFRKWNLRRWKVTGKDPGVITIDNGEGGNVHKLYFNCAGTGFFVPNAGQRGYMEGMNFAGPDDAAAPSSEVVECKQPRIYNVEASGKTPVWIWWDFPHGVPPIFRMNLRTWRKHINPDKFDLFLLNKTNVRQVMPGVPEGFFRLYHAAKSDFLRAGLIATHGGIYLDGDMLLSHDLDVAFKALLNGEADFMPYEGPGDRCEKEAYTTNFMGGTKGNALSSLWISRTIKGMYDQCDLPESENGREPVKVCCYQKDWCPRRECHVHWGEISHPPKLKSVEGKVRLKCLGPREGFSQTMSGAELFFKYFKERPALLPPNSCVQAENDDLNCNNGVGLLKGYMGRHGHHIYNMLQGGRLDGKSDDEILKGDFLISELYRRSLGLA